MKQTHMSIDFCILVTTWKHVFFKMYYMSHDPEEYKCIGNIVEYATCRRRLDFRLRARLDLRIRSPTRLHYASEDPQDTFDNVLA